MLQLWSVFRTLLKVPSNIRITICGMLCDWYCNAMERITTWSRRRVMIYVIEVSSCEQCSSDGRRTYTALILIQVDCSIGLLCGQLQNSVIRHTHTDRPVSKRMSMRSRLRVLLWMSTPRYNCRGVSRSELCSTAIESLLHRFTVLKTSNCAMVEAAVLISKLSIRCFASGSSACRPEPVEKLVDCRIVHHIRNDWSDIISQTLLCAPALPLSLPWQLHHLNQGCRHLARHHQRLSCMTKLCPNCCYELRELECVVGVSVQVWWNGCVHVGTHNTMPRDQRVWKHDSGLQPIVHITRCRIPPQQRCTWWQYSSVMSY